MTHDRHDVRALLRRKLEAGLSLHMPAPRRIGKTWTVHRLAGDLRAAGWAAIEVDVEGIRTPHDFARELCKRIEAQNTVETRFKTHMTQRLANLLGGGWDDKFQNALGRVDPIEFAETLVASLDDTDTKTAIIIDEISYFVLALAEDDAKAAHTFAYKLRALQQRYKNVRWLITGSIGLDTIARRYGLEGAFVDFETVALEPFTADQARSYMRDPDVRQQFTHIFDADDVDFDAMFAELGWLAPYYLKLVANEVRPSVALRDSTARATKADFEAAFDRLLQPNRTSHFAVWREHIAKNLPLANRVIANSVLGLLSKGPDGETGDTLMAYATQSQAAASGRELKETLAILVTDGLIETVGGRYRFRSGLVRRYWRDHEAD